MSIFGNMKPDPWLEKILVERKKCIKKSVDLGYSVFAFEFRGLVEVHSYLHTSRDRCPVCRHYIIVDLKRKMMTCDNRKCKKFDQYLIPIIKRRLS